MFDHLLKLHRFLLGQSFYPLAMAIVLSMAAFVVRVVYSRTLNYTNLVWNLFLAVIPYFFSLLAVVLYHRNPRRGMRLLLPGALWLIFFPNAPYIVTDFYHLEWRPPTPYWFDICLISVFAFTGCFLAIASLRTMQFLVKKYWGALLSWVFVGVVMGLSALGVYLGRFVRYNSWDLLLHPESVLKDLTLRLINPFDHPGFVGFTLLFTAILFVFYLMFLSTGQPQEAE